MRYVSFVLVLLITGIGMPTADGQEPATAQKSEGNSEKTSAAKVDEKEKLAEKDAATKKRKAEGWKSLLPTKGLEGWEFTDFGGVPGNKPGHRDGELLILEMGDPLNGINYKKKDYPKDNFELYVEAKRIEGNDFLCGLTFPVGDEFCSLIAGGWGGGLVGLSSVDGFDASENATTTYHEFENDRWYKFKVRVDAEFVRVWIDDQEFFRQDREGHEFSTRIEVYGSQPLGYCTFQSKVAIKNFQWRPLGKAGKGGGEKTPAVVPSEASKK